MPRPAIGICAAIERVRWGPWDETVVMAPRSYATAVQKAGAIALVLPPDGRANDEPDALLDRLDGLYLAGGSDVDPETYGARPHPKTQDSWPERDAFEVSLTRRALERDMPVLGSCRGMELLNVGCGAGPSSRTSPTGSAPTATGTRRAPTAITRSAWSRARSPHGRPAPSDWRSSSHHHQGIDRVGEGLIATGWSEPDDVIEAIEVPGPALRPRRALASRGGRREQR